MMLWLDDVPQFPSCFFHKSVTLHDLYLHPAAGPQVTTYDKVSIKVVRVAQMKLVNSVVPRLYRALQTVQRDLKCSVTQSLQFNLFHGEIVPQWCL